MGRLRAPLAALAVASLALAVGCTVKTEGAPCTDSNQCPTGQACGYNRVCSVEANGCETTCQLDKCSPAGFPQRCTPDETGICASYVDLSVCTTGQCGVVGGTADCLSVTIVSPGTNASVGAAGTPVTATLTHRETQFVPPDSLELRDGSRSTMLAYQAGSAPPTYTGNYVPPVVEQSVTLTAAAIATPDDVTGSVDVIVDAKPPQISLMVSCPASPSPCLRDDEPKVRAVVVDGHPVTVEASLDLDGHAQKVQVTSGLETPLQFRQWPFDGFKRDVVVRVTATDTFTNMASQEVTLRDVTRARTAHDTLLASLLVTSPAVEADGTIVFGVAASSGQLRGIKPDGATWTTTLQIPSAQGQPLKAAPSVGEVDLFAGSEDGRVYRVLPDGSLPSGTYRWPTPVDTFLVPFNSLFTPAIRAVSGVDRAYSAGQAAALYQFYSSEVEWTLAMADPAHAAGVFADVNPFIATSNGTAATLRRFDDVPQAPVETSAVALLDPGPPIVPCDKVEVPLAVDGGGSVIAVCKNGQVHRVANASPLVDEILYKLPAAVSPTGSPVVLADGGILIPTSDGNVRKLVPSGSTATAWPTPASVTASAGEFPTGVAAADDTSGAPAIYATTSQGRIVALDKDGVEKWSGVLEAGAALGFPTIAPVPATAPASALPTLYAGSSTGKLFRVIVDSGLDPNAPWPKAHHDIRNTGSNTSLPP